MDSGCRSPLFYKVKKVRAVERGFDIGKFYDKNDQQYDESGEKDKTACIGTMIIFLFSRCHGKKY
jgi:hypothetical protein